MSLNKTLTAIIFLLNSNAAFACEELSWTVNGKKEGICYHKKYEAMVSAICLDKKCGAVEFLKKVKGLRLSDEGIVQNPGSRNCKFVNGTVVMGANERGSQNAFCQAKDGSLVDLSALGLQAKKQ